MSGIYGTLPPNAGLASPNAQAMIQRFSSMSPEQLQQAVAMMGNSPMGAIAQRVLMQKRMMPNVGSQAPGQATMGAPQAPIAPQAPTASAMQPPAAPTMQPSATPAYARGGGLAYGGSPMGLGMSAADPWWTRRESQDSGLLHSATAGRADQIAANPAVDSYVIPADVVSGLGEGNTLAGARVLTMALGTAPHATPQQTGRHGDTIPRPSGARWAMPPGIGTGLMGAGGNSCYALMQAQSSGGRTATVPVQVAGGEFIVPPEWVRHLGNGDAKRGHKILDEFVVHARKRIIGQMQRLKPPVKPR